MCEGKSTRPSEDAVFLRKEIIDALKRSDERMQVSSIAKMKEEGGDKYKQINESKTNMENKILDKDEKCENRSDETNRAHDKQESRQSCSNRISR